MKKKKILFLVYYHGGLALFSLIMSIIFKLSAGKELFTSAYFFQAAAIFLTAVLTGYTAMFMVKRYQKYSPSELTKKVIPGLILFYIVTYLISQVVITISTFSGFLYYGRELTDFFPHLINYELSYANYQFFFWLMVFTIILFFVLWNNSVKREQRLNEEKLKYQYNNLKSQINPHFLFNSLNTLSELVYADADTANEFIQKLSSIYRYIIENEKSELVPLNDEITFITNYFELQKMRAKNKIELTITGNNFEAYYIAPVSLQLLIENSIKHNSFSKDSPLLIMVKLENDYISVENTLQKKTTLEPSTNKGLQNLKERIALVQKREVIIEKLDNKFIVKIPIEREEK